MPQKYKLSLSYDGSNYSGWQIQPNCKTIQELLEKALQTISKTTVKVIGSGRTDAGVHAISQVCHFTLENPLDPNKILFSLNGLLPPDIRICSCKCVEEGFHARFSAKAKTYRYYLDLNHYHLPFRKLYSYHLRDSLDFNAMELAAKTLEGTHNFRAFANESSKGAAQSSPVKKLYKIEIKKTSSSSAYLEFYGNGFLYKMVRNLVGALIACGKKQLSCQDIKEILVSQDRKKAPKAAPAHGLFLVSVEY